MDKPDEFGPGRAELLSNLAALRRVVSATRALSTVLDNAWLDAVEAEIKTSRKDRSERLSIRLLPPAAKCGRMVVAASSHRIRQRTHPMRSPQNWGSIGTTSSKDCEAVRRVA